MQCMVQMKSKAAGCQKAFQQRCYWIFACKYESYSISLKYHFLEEYSSSCTDKMYLLKTHHCEDFTNKTCTRYQQAWSHSCLYDDARIALFSYKFKEFLFPHNLIHVKRFVLRPCVLWVCTGWMPPFCCQAYAIPISRITAQTKHNPRYKHPPNCRELQSQMRFSWLIL